MPLLDVFWSCFRKVKCFPLLQVKKNAEAEAKRACEWLQATGFPQYVQLFEGG
ncbi:StAR related lipid transfer domain containing 8 [Homo sapiens]|uniref:StAR related lipid transfer domain containing 8 n=1 Tax=Homo sapiens TaxID=9606 RepID=E5RFN7_HUMAN|nr:StAR related lipid transfer domain containing 8 [Homo sapiens]KAI4000039.1 StAR related lipid transfer domain containing 8 [Homo sapiens]